MKRMQKKKIVAGITAIVVLALLFAGVGYAFSGTARTYNQGDEQTLAYMSVTPADFNPIFVSTNGGTIFDTYAYEDADPTDPALVAYAFKAASTPVTVPGQPAVTYTALQLGSKNMTVLNNTGEDITALTFNIKATGNVGNTDFVFIFKLTNADSYVSASQSTYSNEVTYYTFDANQKAYAAANPQPANQTELDARTYYLKDTSAEYIVYNGVNNGSATINASLFDTKSNTITVTVYIGYVVNVYVPNNYIGPASATEKHETVYWTDGVTYYDDSGCVNASNPQPANQADVDAAIEAHTPYYEKWLPYRQTTTAPADLLATSFGIEVVDGNA